MTTAFMGAFRTEQAVQQSTNGHRPPRTPLLVHAGRWAARALPRWRTARTAAMQTTAFAGITWAAWTTEPRLGAVAGAVSLLVLEALTGEGRR